MSAAVAAIPTCWSTCDASVLGRNAARDCEPLRRMPSISPADLRLLQRRKAAPQLPRLIPGGVIFCAPGRLSNPLNRRKGAHWSEESGYRAEWHEKVAAGLVEASYHLVRGSINPRTPKVVKIQAHVERLFDSETEGLQAACKAIPDALQKFGVIHSDADDSGHKFEYSQVVDRTWLGVEVEVRPA